MATIPMNGFGMFSTTAIKKAMAKMKANQTAAPATAAAASDPEAITLDLSDTSQRSPGQVRTGTSASLPSGFLNLKSATDMMKAIRAKAKQALPTAPATLPPGTTGFKVNPLLALAGIGLVGYFVFGKKGKGKVEEVGNG